MTARHLTIAALLGTALFGQIPTPPPATPAAPGPAPLDTTQAFRIEATPLAPFDPASPFASPRDAARHRMAYALAALTTSRDVGQGLQGLLQSAALDPTYQPALFNLGILCQLLEKWDDAQSFLEAAERREAGNWKKAAETELERVRLVAKLVKTEEGKRSRAYGTAIVAAADRGEDGPLQETIDIWAAVMKIDPARWEAPARIGVLISGGRQYAEAVRFFAAAARNASEHRALFERMRDAAQREAAFQTADEAGRAAWDSGKYDVAAGSFRQAWQVFPDRASLGLESAAAYLVKDDFGTAAEILGQIRGSGMAEPARRATAMLEAVKEISPQSREALSKTPAPLTAPENWSAVAGLTPPLVTDEMRLLSRAPARLSIDPEPPRASLDLAIDASGVAAALPAEASAALAPRLAGTSPFSEFAQIAAQASRPPSPPAVSKVELPPVKGKRSTKLNVTSTPDGADVAADEGVPVCKTPCELVLPAGSHVVRLTRLNFEPFEKKVSAVRDASVEAHLDPQRGFLVVEGEVAGLLAVNGALLAQNAPILSLPVGTYRFTRKDAAGEKEQFLTVRADRPLRLVWR